MQAKLDGSTEMTFENLRQRLDPPGITDASRTLQCLCAAAAMRMRQPLNALMLPKCAACSVNKLRL